MDLFTVFVRGFGDLEDAYYACGTFSTKDKAEARVEVLLDEWAEDGFEREDVDYYIEEHKLDG